jgi:hypothetical protein
LAILIKSMQYGSAFRVPYKKRPDQDDPRGLRALDTAVRDPAPCPWRAVAAAHRTAHRVTPASSPRSPTTAASCASKPPPRSPMGGICASP